MSTFDVAFIGNYTKDRIIDTRGERWVDGGAFNYGANVAVRLGLKTSAVTRLANHPAAVGEVFNIGGTQEISIIDLARRIKTLTASPSEVVFIPYDQAYKSGFEDMHRRLPSIQKTRIQKIRTQEPEGEMGETTRNPRSSYERPG